MATKNQKKSQVTKRKAVVIPKPKRMSKKEVEAIENSPTMKRKHEAAKEFFKTAKFPDVLLNRIKNNKASKMLHGTSPFEFQNPVSGRQFLNHKKYLKELCLDLSGSALAFVLGYRGSGITSLAFKLVDQLKRKYKDHVVIYVSLKGCKTEFDLLSKYIIPLINALDEKSILEDIEIKNDYLHDRQRLTELPERMAKRRKRKVVVIIDDFEVIIGMPNQNKVEELLSTAWQNQKWISTCVFMEQTFATDALIHEYGRPFYDPEAIQKSTSIKLHEWYKYISAIFKRNNQSIGEKEIKYIVFRMNGIPKFIQSLSHYVYLNGKSKITIDDIDEALNVVVELDRPSYRTIFNKFTQFQKRVLISLVSEKPIVVPNRYVEKTKAALERVTNIANKQFNFLNPYFEHYLTQQIDGTKNS